MKDHHDDARRWTRRRKQVATTAVGLTALLGVGAYVITAQTVGGHDTATERKAGAQVPLAASAGATPVGMGKGEANPEPSPARTRSLTPEEQIRASRAAAVKDGHPVQRPLMPAPEVQPAGDFTERNEKVKNGSLRIITAHSDLTGQRELLWAADKGTRYGNITCFRQRTQCLAFSRATA